MGRRSSIEQLPQELFDEISRALNEGKTIEEVVAHMKGFGANLSPSAVGRHKKKIEEVAGQLRKSRMIAEALGREFGDKPDDKLARLNIELLHDQVMRFVSEVGEDGETQPMDAKQLNFIADALYRLAAARKFDADRQIKERQAMAQAAAKEVDKVAAKTPGMSKDTVDEIKRKILGLAK